MAVLLSKGTHLSPLETNPGKPSTPILTLFELLMNAIGEQGLKPTAKGNLPRNFCREAALAYWGEQQYREKTRFGGINRGEDFNWAYRDGYPELRFIRSAFLFTLYLLTRYGDTWRPQAFYENAFLGAFPMLLDEVPPSQIISPDRKVRLAFTWRALVHFAGFLGAATAEPVSDELLCREYRVKSLPLLGQSVQFQHPKYRFTSWRKNANGATLWQPCLKPQGTAILPGYKW